MEMLANHHESILILTELTSVFTDEKDAQMIADIKEKENVFRERHEAKQRELKNNIKALTADLRKIESKAQRKEPKEQFVAKMEAMAKEKDVSQSNLDSFERNMKKLEDDLNRLVLLEGNIETKTATLARDGEELSRTQHLLSLYCAVSNIEWSECDDMVEGHVTLPSDVRPFSYNPTKSSKVDLANKLWDLMA